MRKIRNKASRAAEPLVGNPREALVFLVK